MTIKDDNALDLRECLIKGTGHFSFVYFKSLDRVMVIGLIANFKSR